MSRTVIKARRSEAPRPFLVEFSEGDRVFSEGDLGAEMYVLQSGRVELTRAVDGESESVTVLEKGDFFGEMAILEGLPRNATATALETTQAVEVSASTFSRMLLDNPEIAIRMMRKLSRRLRLADELLRAADGPGPWEAPDQPAEPAAQCKLLHVKTESEFPLSSGVDTTIGRRDPVTGINPDIDLSEIDPERSTSRRHALVRREEERFFVVEEIGTTNGTFVAGRRLETDVPVEIHDGEDLKVGLIELEFHVEG